VTVSDLSPDALARLEMKLLADLEVVRKVRALLEEHRGALGIQNPPTAQMPSAPGGTTASAPSASVMPVQASPTAPHKSTEETFTECLMALPEGGFTIKNFRQALRKMSDMTPRDTLVKTFFNKMIRKGCLVVLESRVGRSGSLYRCTIPRPKPPEDSPGANVPPPAPGTSAGESADTPPAV